MEEGACVLDAMARHGLRRGDSGLEICVMCEIPNNVIQTDAFCRLFDGISMHVTPHGRFEVDRYPLR